MTAIAILTFNRLSALQTSLKTALGSIMKSGQYKTPIAVFEDCGQADQTRSWLQSANNKPVKRPDLLATHHPLAVSTHPAPKLVQVFLGTDNLGVAGNSNRAIKWFMDETEADHLLLCNDDVEFVGDAVKAYSTAHDETNIELLCFCDLPGEQFKCTPLVYRGVRLKRLNRMTGMVMSMTRKLVESIGYYDCQFGKFGEDHCDVNIRARYAGHINVHNIQQYSLDIDPIEPVLRHQKVESCIGTNEKPDLDRHAHAVMIEKSKRYPFTNPYVGFSLRRNVLVDSINDRGTEVGLMVGYQELP
jgi:hypothetical protein